MFWYVKELLSYYIYFRVEKIFKNYFVTFLYCSGPVNYFANFAIKVIQLK